MYVYIFQLKVQQTKNSVVILLFFFKFCVT
jgi:hypothetical protein